MKPNHSATLVIALGALLAGCLQEPASDTLAEPTQPGAPELTFLPAIDIAASDGGESFVAVSRDGRDVLTCNHGDFTEPSPAWMSQDGGASYERLTIDPSPMVGGDCETAVMDDGTWVFLSSTIAGATVSTSSDRGKTWATNPLSAIPTNGLCDRPWIDGVGERLMLSCMTLFAQPGWVGVQTSDDKGRTWTTPTHVTTNDPERTTVIHGNTQIFPDGAIFLPIYKYPQPTSMTCVPTPNAMLGFAVSEDQGETWREMPVLDPVNTLLCPPTAAVAGSDRIYYPFSSPNGTWSAGPLPEGKTDMKVVYSEDRGKTWSDPVTIASGMSRFGIPWADGALDGTAAVLLQIIPSEVGLEGDEPSIVVFRIDADVPGLVVSKAVVGAGGAEFSTVDHDTESRAYVSFGGALNRVAVEAR